MGDARSVKTSAGSAGEGVIKGHYFALHSSVCEASQPVMQDENHNCQVRVKDMIA